MNHIQNLIPARCLRIAVLSMLLLMISADRPLADGAPSPLAVIGYWHGDATTIETHAVRDLTHINFSFVHLDHDQLSVRNAADSASIRQLVSLKARYPGLKVFLSFGGWGGCKTCSEVFSTGEGRRDFAQSVRRTLDIFHADGIDLDWEYPAIEGYPEHPFKEEDRHHFTQLVRELRDSLGSGRLITFAAGGFTKYLASAIEWNQVMPLVDWVNLMTYDLINANSTETGHHTPLYSTPRQLESTDHAVHLLDSLGVPRKKMVIGLAFYARVWGSVPAANNGLYQAGSFLAYVPYRQLSNYFARNEGFQLFWDSTAHAPYAYNSRRGLFATYDDERSVAEKTRYAIHQGLGGVMFWELSNDSDDLLGAISRARKEGR